MKEFEQRCEDCLDISGIKIIINSFIEHSGYGQVIYFQYLARYEQGKENHKYKDHLAFPEPVSALARLVQIMLVTV